MESDLNKLVLPCAEADLLSVNEACFPFRIRVIEVEILVIGVVVPEKFHMFVEAAARIDRHFVAKIDTGLVKRDRIE
jgi:hypothetical protein